MALDSLFVDRAVNSQRLRHLESPIDKKRVVWLSTAGNGLGAVHPERCYWRPWRNKVRIPRHYAEYVEYDGDPGFGEKRKGPVPERTFESKLSSFGMDVRFPDMRGKKIRP